MKWNSRQLVPTLTADKLPPVMFVFGDDSGQVRKLSAIYIQSTGIDTNDPFAAEQLSTAEIAADPARLLDAIGAIPFGGGLRLITITGIGSDTPASELTALNAILKEVSVSHVQHVRIIIPAPFLDKSHALVRILEKADFAAVVRCYQESIRDLREYVTSTCTRSGKTITPPALHFFIDNQGADVGITQLELTKIILYTHDATQIELEDVVTTLSGAPAQNIFNLCDSIGQRDKTAVNTYLQQLVDADEDMNMVFALAVRHLRRVLAVKESVAGGMVEKDALRALRPPVSFGQDKFMAQVKAYPLKRLQRITQHAIDVQMQARNATVHPNLILSRALLAWAS